MYANKSFGRLHRHASTRTRASAGAPSSRSETIRWNSSSTTAGKPVARRLILSLCVCVFAFVRVHLWVRSEQTCTKFWCVARSRAIFDEEGHTAHRFVCVAICDRYGHERYGYEKCTGANHCGCARQTPPARKIQHQALSSMCMHLIHCSPPLAPL